jgi:hypothetical protein
MYFLSIFSPFNLLHCGVHLASEAEVRISEMNSAKLDPSLAISSLRNLGTVTALLWASASQS